MIANDKQYEITRQQAEKFQAALDDHKKYKRPPFNVHPRIFQAQEDAIKFQLDYLLSELKEYEEKIKK